MTLNIKSKKGYVLLMAMVFIIILIISSIGLFFSVEQTVKDIRVEEVEYTRGYYAATAGLRYAAILLKDPVTYCGFSALHDGQSYVVQGDELGGDFFNDIGAGTAGPEANHPDLNITITEYDPVTPQWTEVDQYRVTAEYEYY